MARRAIKQKIVYRYRDRPRSQAQIEVSGDGPVNVGAKVSGVVSKFNEFRQVAITLGSVIAMAWIFLGPFVNAQAEELLRLKLTDIGMDPANIQSLNNNLEELKKQSEERNAVVEGIKGDIDKIIIILEQQQRQIPMYPPIQMQAAPPPVPAQ